MSVSTCTHVECVGNSLCAGVWSRYLYSPKLSGWFSSSLKVEKKNLQSCSRLTWETTIQISPSLKKTPYLVLYWILGLILIRAVVFKGSHNTEVGTESSQLFKKRSTHFKRYKNIHRTGHGPFPEKFPFSGGSCICINPSSGAQRRMQLMNTSWQETGWGTEVRLQEALGAAKGPVPREKK